MPTATVSQNNQQLFAFGNLPGEDLEVSFGASRQLDGLGCYRGRPSQVSVVLRRRLPPLNVHLVLLHLIASARQWVNQQRDGVPLPSLTLTLDVPDGATLRNTQTDTLEDIAIASWTMSWHGSGAGNRKGLILTETANIVGLTHAEVILADNGTSHMTLD